MIEINRAVKNIRRNIIRVAENCSGKVHWGSSLSCVEILYTIYGITSNIAQKNVDENDEDVIIISKGQAALAMYATMYEVGLIDDSFITQFQKNGGDYPEEITENRNMKIPCSTGSLGVGLPYAVGVALKKKMKKYGGDVYVLVGDGECDEGSIWEAVMLAAHYKLNNIVLIVDCNGLQADGETRDILNLDKLPEKFQSFGWDTIEVDGHSCIEIKDAYCKKADKPFVIIAHTVKGKGISFMENDFTWHDKILNKELLIQAKREVET